MPPPKFNTNARKGNTNRQMYSQRLPVETIKFIKAEAKRLEISCSDFIIILIEKYLEILESELRR